MSFKRTIGYNQIPNFEQIPKFKISSGRDLWRINSMNEGSHTLFESSTRNWDGNL